MSYSSRESLEFEKDVEVSSTPGPDRFTSGIVLIAMDDSGEILYHRCVGKTSPDPEHAQDITADSTMWIASCSKLVTAVAVMQCVERGQLSLEQDITTLLPEWRNREMLTGFGDDGTPILTKSTKTITLKHLLTHSSGMCYDFMDASIAKWIKWVGKEKTGIIGQDMKIPLMFEPGTNWNYGPGVDWAGLMVERVNGGMKLGKYMEANIFRPLGIKHAVFRPVDSAVVASRMCDMTRRTSGIRGLELAWINRNTNPIDDLGGEGLFTSPKEFVKILTALLVNDGALLHPSTVRQMFAPAITDSVQLNENLRSERSGRLLRSGVDCDEWNFSCAGLVNMVDVEGTCSRGSVAWCGLPNLFWWIDVDAGHCGMYASQLLPPGDAKSVELARRFRRMIHQLRAARG